MGSGLRWWGSDQCKMHEAVYADTDAVELGEGWELGGKRFRYRCVSKQPSKRGWRPVVVNSVRLRQAGLRTED